MLTVLSLAHPSVTASITAHVAAMAAEAGTFDARCVIPGSVAGAGQPGRFTRALRRRFGSTRLSTYAGLRRLVAEQRPDVLHVQADPCSLLALQVVRLRDRQCPGAAVVLECDHAIDLSAGWPYSWIRRRVLGSVDAVVARHQYGLRVIAEAAGFKGSGFVVPPRIADRAVPLLRRDDARASLGIPPTASLVVGFSGELVAANGIVDVLEAVAACRSQVVLVVQGDGKLRPDIQDRAAALNALDRLCMVTAPPKDAAGAQRRWPDILAAIDALIVMPKAPQATRIALDRRIGAAQTCGVPVIVADEGGLGELVGPGGWLIETGDPGLLSSLLNRLAADPDQVERITAITRDKVAGRYHEANVQEGLLRAFKAARSVRCARAAERGRIGDARAHLQSGGS